MFKSEATSETNLRIPAYIESGCYICEKCFSTASNLIKHKKVFHSIELTPRKTGKNRPQSVKYEFKTKKQPYRRTLMGCPSCWFYCPFDYRRMAQHIRGYHLDEENEDTEDPIDEDEADFEEYNNLDNMSSETSATKGDVFAAIEALSIIISKNKFCKVMP